MNRMRSLLLCAAFTTVSMNVAFAQEKRSPEFTEDLSVLFSQVTPKLQKSRIHRLSDLPSVKRGQNKAGIYVPSVGASIINHPAYISAKDYLPQLDALDPVDRQPLTAQWSSIERKKGELTTEASNIDSADSSLYSEVGPLNQEKARLDKKQGDLNGDIDRYNSECTGRPLPPDEYNVCQGRRSALLERIRLLNIEIDTYNAKVEAWRAKLDALKKRSSSLDSRVLLWVEQINKFTKAAEEALTKLQVTSVRVQAQGGGLERSIKLNLPRPVTLAEGNSMLDQLWLMLSPTQQDRRVEAFTQARSFMKETSIVGGVTAPPIVRRTYHNTNENPADARVDVEIFRGRAFVDGIGISK